MTCIYAGCSNPKAQPTKLRPKPQACAEHITKEESLTGRPQKFATIKNARTLCTLIDDSLANADIDKMYSAHAFDSVFMKLVQAAAVVLGNRPDEVVADLTTNQD